MSFDTILPFLQYQFGGNTLQDYLVALFVFAASIIVLKIFKKVVIKKIKQVADHTATDFDDLLIGIVDSLGWPFYGLVSLYVAAQFVILPQIGGKALSFATLILFAYYIVRGIQKLIDYGLQKTAKRLQKKEGGERFDPSVTNVLGKILKGAVWGIAIILVLQNVGYNVSTLLAGLGIGGLAVAFALQNILSDIFASFALYFDKPFRTGDFIIIGSDMGTIKHIGIRSTRLQTLQGQELVISNKELTETRVNNYKRMDKRRIVFEFGVVYETSTEKLKRIPRMVKEIIESVNLAELDRVHFAKFGDFSLNFEVVYYVQTGDYKQYMDTQQSINFQIKERFEQEGIAMAYPTQTIFINKVP